MRRSQRASTMAEYGFLLLKLDARTNTGMGRRVMDASYKQLGVVEMDDFAAGIRSLWSRPYVDPHRVGVYGTSYGGTVAATVLLRHPDVVQAAVSNSPVTDYRLYDTAYSERYLGLPEDDGEAYSRAAVLSYANQLRGDLLIYYGTSDDNVHNKNALQFIKALQAAGKSFEVQVGPDKGHTGLDQTRMMEFFIQHLVIEAAATPRRRLVQGLRPAPVRASGQAVGRRAFSWKDRAVAVRGRDRPSGQSQVINCSAFSPFCISGYGPFPPNPCYSAPGCGRYAIMERSPTAGEQKVRYGTPAFRAHVSKGC